MRRSAFMVGALDVSKSPPVLIGVEIFSDDAGGVCASTSTRFLFDIVEGRGEDYPAAVQNARECARLRGYGWVIDAPGFL